MEWSDDSEHYPIDQTKCMQIDDVLPNVREGELIQTIVKASGGKTNNVEHLVVYTGKEVAEVEFTCRGTTLHYHCNDEGVTAEEQVMTLMIDLFDEILQ